MPPRLPKLIAVDLDGTLLARDGEAHAADVAALRAAAREGVVVSILTGRLYSGTRQSAEVLALEGPVGCADGSHVVHAGTHATLLHHGIAGEHARLLREALLRHGPATFLFARDAIVHDERGDTYLPYVTTWSMDVRRTERLHEHAFWDLDDGVTAVVCVGTEAQIRGAAEAVGTSLAAHAQVAHFPVRGSAEQWGLIARASAGTKGSALAWLADHHRITPAETVVVGDWFNDITMFKIAGRSFAMGQAPPDVKEHATDVLSETSVEGGGIARVVAEVFGIRP